jgi:REP element-mobilizing transposase RayT
MGRCARSARQRGSEPAQLALLKAKGGKRRGAGRKPKGWRAGERHKTRPEHDARHPVHVVLRVVSAVGSLRRRLAYRAIREATLTTAGRADFRIVHLSIQRTHVHLLVEADDKAALSSGMHGFQISAAKHLNAAIGKECGGPRRRGTVFPDRFHAVVIKSPRQARHALSYVINNWRKHGEHRDAGARAWKIDPYSSAVMFRGWKEWSESAAWCVPPQYQPLAVHPPRTWLLNQGWQRDGAISYADVPSARRSG